MLMESNLGQRGEEMDTVVKVSLEKDGVLESSEIRTFKKGLRVSAEKAQDGGDLFPSGEDDALLIANGTGSSTVSLDGERMELSPSFDRAEDDDELAFDCQTPTKNTFDPFAPGPEDLAVFAPKKKVVKESRIPIRRHLNFELCSDSMESVKADVSEDGFDNDDYLLLELICKSFLELILLNQLEEIHMKNSPAKKANIGEGLNSPAKKANIGEEFKTPTYLPFLNGIAETCPPAPRRPTLKARKLADSICKKLDFGSKFEDVKY